MEVKKLLSILNRPWAIEATAAQYWAGIANQIIFHHSTLAILGFEDTRNWGLGYRVDVNGNKNPKGNIQIIEINGPITKYGFCFSAGSQDMKNAIHAAINDITIDSIVLVIDSPGGQVDGTDNLAQEIKNAQKPVIVFVDGMLCSAAYWIGSAADEIWVDTANNGFNATIGSIGTMAMWDDISGKLEKEGIKRNIVYADASTDKNQMLKPDENGEFPQVKAELNNLNNTFLAAVQANRAGKLSSKENVLTGKTYNGREAIKYGLADAMGTFQKVVARAYFLAKS